MDVHGLLPAQSKKDNRGLTTKVISRDKITTPGKTNKLANNIAEIHKFNDIQAVILARINREKESITKNVAVADNKESRPKIHDEQNAFLSVFLAKENRECSVKPEINPQIKLTESVIDYLNRYQNNNEKISNFVRELLRPLNIYGEEQREDIPDSHKNAYISDWLQQAVMGMPFDEWLSEQTADNPSQDKTSISDDKFRFGRIREMLHNINSLSPAARAYYQQQVINNMMPASMLYPAEQHEQERLKQMRIDQPEWGYLHAGAKLLNESGINIHETDLDQLIDAGMFLEKQLRAGKISPQYCAFFKLPAMLHVSQRGHHLTNSIARDDIYLQYFDYLKKNNPFVQLSVLKQNCKTRPELAVSELEKKRISVDNVFNYLYKEKQNDYINQEGSNVTVPGIDAVFHQQNRAIKEAFQRADSLLLSEAFYSECIEEELAFLKKSDIDLVNVRFINVAKQLAEKTADSAGMGWNMLAATLVKMNSVNPLFPGVIRQEKAKNNVEGSIQVPEVVDVLKAYLNGEERNYVVKKDLNAGRYALYRVDEEKICALLDDSARNEVRRNHYKLVVYPVAKLKSARDALHQLADNLSGVHGNKLYETLHHWGYRKTGKQILYETGMGLFPFYTAIQDIRKGEYDQAAMAAAFDILGFYLPLSGEVAVAGRVTAEGEVAGAAASSVAEALANPRAVGLLNKIKEKIFASVMPCLAKKVPPENVRRIGVSILRGFDPGFELLIEGGHKSITGLKNALVTIKTSWARKLSKALEGKEKQMAAFKVGQNNIIHALHPGTRKEISLVKSGQKKGNDIWVRINTETGIMSGKKYVFNRSGELEYLPVSVRERAALLHQEGLGGKGSKLGGRKLKEEGTSIQPLPDTVHTSPPEDASGALLTEIPVLKSGDTIAISAPLSDLITDNVIEFTKAPGTMSRVTDAFFRNKTDKMVAEIAVRIKNKWVKLFKDDIGYYFGHKDGKIRISYTGTEWNKMPTVRGFPEQLNYYPGECATATALFNNAPPVSFWLHQDQSLSENINRALVRNKKKPAAFAAIPAIMAEIKEIRVYNDGIENFVRFPKIKDNIFNQQKFFFDRLSVNFTQSSTIICTAEKHPVINLPHVNYPVHMIQQGTTYSCGYTCAAMIAMDKNLPEKTINKMLEEVREGRAGLSSAQLQSEMSAYGIASHRLVVNDPVITLKDKLENNSSWTGIITMKGHFCIITKAGKNKFYLRDPYQGILSEEHISTLNHLSVEKDILEMTS